MRKVLALRAEAADVPVSLEEEAEFNRKLAEFLTCPNPSARCHHGREQLPCTRPRLVPCDRRLEPVTRGRLSGYTLVVQRYVCLSCGSAAVAAVERVTPPS